MIGFLERVGGAIVRPLTTMRALAATGEGGIGDVVALLGLKLVAGEGPVGMVGGRVKVDSSVLLGRALLMLRHGEVVEAMQGGLQAASRLLPDVIAILVGAVALALFAGRRTGGRELDLAAYAWIPAIAVRALASLALTLARVPPGDAVMNAIDAACLVAAALGWAAALWALKVPRAEDAR